MVGIAIKNQQKKTPISPVHIKKIACKILKILDVKFADVSIAFVTDRKIRALNKKFLKRDHTTDVLAFDFTDDQSSYLPPRTEKKIEGEIVISAVTAYNNAKRFKTTPFEELVLYIVHGLLHLLGYDDHKPAKIKQMRNKEKEILQLLREFYPRYFGNTRQ